MADGRPRYVTVPILVVVLAIAYIYYATVFVLIDEWLGLNTAAGLANAVVFTALALMSLVTYGVAVFKDPGRVPPSFRPDIEDPDSPIHEIKRKKTGEKLLVGFFNQESTTATRLLSSL